MESVAVTVDPVAVNEYIAKQIIDSTLGERLHETVQEALKSFGRYGNDPLKSAVTREVQNQIINLVRTEFAPQIEAAVREAMTPEFIQKLVDGFMVSLTAKIDRY